MLYETQHLHSYFTKNPAKPDYTDMTSNKMVVHVSWSETMLFSFQHS